MNIENFSFWVNNLSGYLRAITHLNDAIGCRHGFFAEVVDADESDFCAAIAKRYEFPDFELKRIGSYSDAIRVFADMVKRNVFHNFLLGESLPDGEKESFIREQIQWHIEDYITMIETEFGCRPDSWQAEFVEERGKFEFIIFKFRDFAIIVCFSYQVGT